MNTDVGLEAVEFRSSRSKTLLVSGVCAATAILFAAGALIEPSAWPWLGTACFGAGAVLIFLNGFYRPATLRLDAKGVDFVHWKYRWSLAWADIAEVRHVVLRINFSKVKENVVLLDGSGKQYTITSGLNVSPARLAALIRNRCPALSEMPRRGRRRFWKLGRKTPRPEAQNSDG